MDTVTWWYWYSLAGQIAKTLHTHTLKRTCESIIKQASLLSLVRTPSVPLPLGLDLPFGSTLHEELQLLNGVGLTLLEALRAGTVESAKWHQLLDRGEISTGKRADLVLLNSNPLLNISNTRDITRVWVSGVEV
jgi:hypothetical protein